MLVDMKPYRNAAVLIASFIALAFLDMGVVSPVLFWAYIALIAVAALFTAALVIKALSEDVKGRSDA